MLWNLHCRPVPLGKRIGAIHIRFRRMHRKDESDPRPSGLLRNRAPQRECSNYFPGDGRGPALI